MDSYEKEKEECPAFGSYDPTVEECSEVICGAEAPELHEKCIALTKAMKKEEEKMKVKIKKKEEAAAVVKPAAGAPNKTKKTVNSKGRNPWGHLIGSQADKIDQVVLAGKKLTDVNKIVEATKLSKSRVLSHLAHLRAKGLLN